VIFRREPIHKKLAREAELRDAPEMRIDEVRDPGARGMWGATGVHGVPRPRRWDAVASALAPGLAGDEIHFVALPSGDLIVDEDEPEDTLAPLAEAIEQTVQPPYRAEAVRQREDVWAVAARRARVTPIEADGDELELVVSDAGRALTVDGERVFGSIAELEEIGRSEGEHYIVRAHRLDNRLWEIEADPL
jgi:hypothetical protein